MVKGISRCGTFKVLNSNGAWALLFGKPMLETFNALHDYSKDIICLPQGKEWITLENQFANVQGATGDLLANLTINIRQLINTSGDETSSPSRGVLYCKSDDNQSANRLAHLAEKSKTSLKEVTEMEDTEQGDTKEPEGRWDLLWLLDPVAGSNLSHPGIEQPDITKTFEPTLLMRKTNPHNPAHVEAILNEITLGQDLTMAQHESIHLMIAEYVECFALSMSEVEGALLRLNIPQDRQFRTKINQRPQSPPQREFFNGVINKMLAADIIQPIAHQDVKCCGATTLAKKAHEGEGLTLDTLKHRINDECIAAGFPSAFEHLPPMPQGDIHLKQQNLSGHRWITVFDFANRFYACEIEPEDQPYVCFYMEG